jgi:galactose mutarotase-like enzyme
VTAERGLSAVEISSSGGVLRAAFVPGAGMVCCSLLHEGKQLLSQRSGVRAYADRGSTMGIPLLYPWANRLSGFSYGAPPDTVRLSKHDPRLKLDANGLPIHGVIAGNLPWELDRGGEDQSDRLRARMRWQAPELLEIFPFAHQLEIDARIIEQTLTIETVVRADSGVAVPVSFGYHPYLTIPASERSAWEVELPLMRRLLLDAQMIPTGAAEPFERRRLQLADSDWDDSFADPERPAIFVVSAAAGRRIELELLEGYSYAQVYAPAGENFICFEPMTAPTNALVSRAQLPLVAPGEEFRAAFRISVAA